MGRTSTASYARGETPGDRPRKANQDVDSRASSCECRNLCDMLSHDVAPQSTRDSSMYVDCTILLLSLIFCSFVQLEWSRMQRYAQSRLAVKNVPISEPEVAPPRCHEIILHRSVLSLYTHRLSLFMLPTRRGMSLRQTGCRSKKPVLGMAVKSSPFEI